MSDDQQHPDEPDWLDEFEEFANRQLGSGSSCEQIHPIIEKWYRDLLQTEPPQARPSVQQAIACLATEILYDSPPEILEEITKHVDEETLAVWIEYVLTIGRALEISLREGNLDDL